jgi:predicted enzyme related to lactoylglutathione lyase
MRRPRHFVTLAAMIVAAACAAAPLAAGPAKPLPADVGPGRVAWFDITTTDLAKAKAFYGALFGWTFGPVVGSDQAAEIEVKGRGIGTIRVADGAISGFNGVVYVQVNDLLAHCAKAKELGGTVVPGFPFDLPDGTGAIAVFSDPSGHPLGMYSRALLPKAAPAAK